MPIQADHDNQLIESGPVLSPNPFPTINVIPAIDAPTQSRHIEQDAYNNENNEDFHDVPSRVKKTPADHSSSSPDINLRRGMGSGHNQHYP
jgi:hypothetical protein